MHSASICHLGRQDGATRFAARAAADDAVAEVRANVIECGYAPVFSIVTIDE